MTPEEIKQVVEDYRKSSQSLNEFIEIDFKKLRNLRVKDSDKVNGDKDKKNGNGAQGATNGAQGAQSSTTTGAQGAQSNDSVGAQGAQSSTTTGAQGAQSSTTTGAQGAQTNTIKKNEIDQFIRQGKEVTINDFGGIKPSNPSGKVIPKPTKPLMTNSPAAKAGIPLDTRQKFANQNAAFQATKNKDSGYTKMDFIKDFPDSQTAKKYNKGEKIPGFSYKKNLNNSYEPYDLVLDYVLTEGHADSVEEAHYVMMQMDEGTIQTIVEFLGGRPGDGYLGHPNLDIKNPFFRGKRTKGPVLNKSNADKLPDVNVNKVGATIGDRNMKLKKMIDDI